jgi:hypothetical protein
MVDFYESLAMQSSLDVLIDKPCPRDLLCGFQLRRLDRFADPDDGGGALDASAQLSGKPILIESHVTYPVEVHVLPSRYLLAVL